MLNPRMLHFCCKQSSQPLTDLQTQQDRDAIVDCLNLIRGPYDAQQDIPVAAKIWHPESGWIAQSVNTSMHACDATAHAEINAIRQACSFMNNYRLPGCTLYVTLEPCLMCFSAAIEARVSRIVFAASDRKLGVLSKQAYRSLHNHSNHHFSWTGGVCATEASLGIEQFFRLICRK